MRNRLKYTLAIMILPVFLFNFGGYLLVSRVLLNHTRSQVWASLELEDDIRRLSIDRAAMQDRNIFSWLEPGREFSYKGLRYDVLSMNAEGNAIEFRCFADAKESQLADSVSKMLARMLDTGEEDEEESGTSAGKEFLSSGFKIPILYSSLLWINQHYHIYFPAGYNFPPFAPPEY